MTLVGFQRILSRAVCPDCKDECGDTYLCSSCDYLHCSCCHTRIVLVPEKIAKKARKAIDSGHKFVVRRK